jgi:putative ABC transport system substrate-binding protein
MAKKSTKKSPTKKKKKAIFFTNHIIGVLHTGSQTRFSALVEDMRQAALQYFAAQGFPSDTIQIHQGGHYSDDNASLLVTHASALVAAPSVKVILAAGGPQSALAAMDAADDADTPRDNVPIVFTTVADPEGLGLVDSLDEPGGNLTGVAGKTSENDPKRLKLLHAYVSPRRPTASKVGVLINPGRQGYHKQFHQLKKAARNLGLKLVPVRAKTIPQIQNAFIRFRDAQFLGVVVTADAFFNNKRATIISEANLQDAVQRGVPTIYQWRSFAEDGGLISFGPSITHAYQEAGRYVARICLGELPKDMECAPPGPFELIVKQSTAVQVFNDPAHVPPPRLLGKKVIVIP